MGEPPAATYNVTFDIDGRRYRIAALTAKDYATYKKRVSLGQGYNAINYLRHNRGYEVIKADDHTHASDAGQIEQMAKAFFQSHEFNEARKGSACIDIRGPDGFRKSIVENLMWRDPPHFNREHGPLVFSRGMANTSSK